jgi:pimeloyl-ACP methyl ester carboxylesterase
MTMKSALFTAAGSIAAGAALVTYAAYRKDIRAARRRIETGRQFLDTPHGPIEFAESGDGPALFVVHGAGGGFDQGLDLGRAFAGDAFRVIAPSRFGYLGTPVPEDASAEAQADAHFRLIDALQLERVPVIAVSAGAPSAMQLCLTHPERCSALVLIVPLAFAPQDETNAARSRVRGAVLNGVASNDFLFWAATKVAHSMLVKTILGTPVQDYRSATPHDQKNVDRVLRTLLPVSERFAGIENDGVVASTLTRYRLEDLQIPTLVITTADDLYGTYKSSIYTAEQIHDGKLVAFPTGGHMLVGHDAEARAEVTRFLKACSDGKKAMAV